jgi:tRNA(fMet)-specific endonuclease VapC
MIYLLDSNLCIQYLRGRNQLIRQRVASHPVADLCLCSVVKAELYYGALHSARPAYHRSRVDSFVQPIQSLPFDDAAADVHACVRQNLAVRGLLIGPYDLQIAAIALVHGLILVTHNTAEFSRVPGLQLEDWEIP